MSAPLGATTPAASWPDRDAAGVCVHGPWKRQQQETAMRHISTTCPYCGVGCGVRATLADGQLTAVAGDADHPVNYGRLCVKGSALHETLGEQGRLMRPDRKSVV